LNALLLISCLCGVFGYGPAAVGDMPDTLVPRQRTGSMLMHCVLESVAPVADPPDVLDRQKCLEALALLRHAKWFQV